MMKSGYLVLIGLLKSVKRIFLLGMMVGALLGAAFHGLSPVERDSGLLIPTTRWRQLPRQKRESEGWSAHPLPPTFFLSSSPCTWLSVSPVGRGHAQRA